jgi:hypothetical protein
VIRRFVLGAVAGWTLAATVHGQTLDERLAALDAEAAAIGTHGANFPDTLDLHRRRAAAYAEAFETDCADHQARAAAEAALYEQNPYATLLPRFDIQRARLDATLAFGRGQCADSDEELTRETVAARDTALQGLAIAAQQHDYDNEALLRFDVAHYSHLLQDEAATIEYLRSAIAVDDQHGLKADGDDNRQILATWVTSATDAVPPPPALPPVTFRFQWRPTTVDDDSTVVVTGITAGTVSTKTFDQSHQEIIEKRPEGGFRQTIRDVSIRSRSAYAADDEDARLAHFVEEITAHTPPIDIAADGAFIGISNYDAFIARVREAADTFVRSQIAEDSPQRATLAKGLPNYLESKFSRTALENEEAESHALNTSIWIGSTLDVGQTMSLDLTLPLQGVPNATVAHRFEFRLDGRVACSAQETAAPRCVELEMEARPDPAQLARIAKTLAQQGKGDLHYWSSLNYRLVVDPSTMQGYAADSHRAYYLQLGDAPIEAQRLDTHSRAHYRN